MGRTANPGMRISFIQIGRSFLLAVIVAAFCAGGEPRLEKVGLLESAKVSQDTITLADLLPSNAPSSVKEIAAHASLGLAPQPGSWRALTSAQIESRLRDTPDLLARLEIPDRVLVTRAYRALSRGEIVRSIEEALKTEGLGDSDRLKDALLRLDAPVLVAHDDAGIKAVRVEYDRLQRKAVFRLWASNEPRLLPFYVSIDNFPRAEQLAERTATPAGGNAPKGRTQSAILVAAGKPARLVGEGPNFRFSTIVVPLQPGRKGQFIRVRERGTRRLLRAEVVGEGLLRAQF